MVYKIVDAGRSMFFKVGYSVINMQMKNQKAQVTIFIIIAILIIAVVVLFFSFRGEIGKEKPVSPEIAPIQNFVEECIYDTGEDALYFIGLHGGYYLPNKFSNSLGIPYYIKDNKTLMPSKEKIELEVSKYIDEALPLCVGNFTEFENFQIRQGKIKTQTNILEEQVILNVDYPLTIIKGEEKSRIEKFENIKIPVRLGIIYNASSFIVSEHLKNTGEICMSCLLDLQTREGLSIMTQSEDNTIIYNIVDSESLLKEKENIFEPEKYSFRFAVEY